MSTPPSSQTIKQKALSCSIQNTVQCWDAVQCQVLSFEVAPYVTGTYPIQSSCYCVVILPAKNSC